MRHTPKDDSGWTLRNGAMETCHSCGGEMQPGEGYLVEEWDYPWDGSDTEGSITEKMDEWYEHPSGVECLKTACRTGNNLDYLLWWARGCPESGFGKCAKQWSDMARDAYNAHRKGERELAEMIARGEEGALRESGWGGLAGSRGRGE